MRRLALLLLCLALPLLARPPSASKATVYERNPMGFRQSSPLPKPDEHGEYTRDAAQTHPFWEVVAPDGLNGRQAVDLIKGIPDPLSWPVVRNYPPGQLLTATAGPHPQVLLLTISDKDGKFWMRVLSGDSKLDETGVFVRAHQDFIRPVKVQE